MNEDLSDASSSYFFIFLHDLVIKNGTNGLLHLSFLLLEYLLLIVVEDHYDCNNRLLLPLLFPPYLTDPDAMQSIWLTQLLSCVMCAALLRTDWHFDRQDWRS